MNRKELKGLYKNFETKCKCEIVLWEKTVKYEKTEETFYIVQKRLIGKHDFIIYDFRFNYTNKTSALNKIDKLCDDLKKDNFELLKK